MASKQDTNFAIYPSLSGRMVLVTGGATGIGESIVTHFARQGSRVAFLDVLDGPAEHLAQSLAAEGCPQPRYLHCDLTDLDALAAAVKMVIAEFGTVDVLVNNAANDDRHLVEEVTPAYWEKCMAINLRPQFFAIQAVLPAMRAAGRGAIVNISSLAWVIPGPGMSVYIAAKAAIVGLTRSFAKELGPENIRVNAVLPGAISTERQRRLWDTPEIVQRFLDNQAIKRRLEPADVARVILFLAADDSSAITNQSYVVDGGWV